MLKLFIIFFIPILCGSSIASASPCLDLGIDFDAAEGQAKVEWVIDGKILEVRKNGSFIDCDHAGKLELCGSVDLPELITLDEIKFLKGKADLDQDGRVVISRISHCFSGALSKMNDKPELRAIGKRMRFFGIYERSLLRYFYVEPADVEIEGSLTN